MTKQKDSAERFRMSVLHDLMKNNTLSLPSPTETYCHRSFTVKREKTTPRGMS